MSQKTTPCPPLTAVQKFGKKHPDVWANIDNLVSASKRGEINAKWDFNLCYCPISAAIGAMMQYYPQFQASGYASFAAALASWRRGKLIYQFDETLADEVLQTASDLVIPIDIIEQLPAPCIYIGFPEYAPDENGTKPSAGFFVHIEHDVNTGKKELRMHYINSDGDFVTQYIVHLIPGGTINDGIDEAIRTIRKNKEQQSELAALTKFVGTLPEDFLENTRELTVQAVQFVLYICAENADIQENETQAKIYRKSDRTLDKFREIRKWDVGVKTGVILRSAEKRQRGQTAETSTREYEPRQYRNRPHIRRAHWHHFWTGSGDNKKLILRWVNSTIINANDGDIPLTIVEKGKTDE